MATQGSHSRGLPWAVLVATLCAALLATCLGASPAGAVVAQIEGRSYGVAPVAGVNTASMPAFKRALRASGGSTTGPVPYDKTAQLTSHGGPVMHSVTAHIVYWDPGAEFKAPTTEIFHKFFADVAHDSGSPTNVFGVGGQYTDFTGHAAYMSTFGGESVDKTPYPLSGCTTPKGEFADPGPYTRCLTDLQLQTELSKYIEKEGLPTGLSHVYTLLLPHKVVSCFPEENPVIKELACSNNVFCAYHSSIEEPGLGEILYSVIPFSLLDSAGAKGCQHDNNSAIQLPNGDAEGTNASTRYADVALKYTSHEYIETATDPLGTGWWEGLHGQEIGDKCNAAGTGLTVGTDPNAFLPTLGGSAGTLFNQAINTGHYYLQSEWDNAAKACTMQPVPIAGAAFTSVPSTGLPGQAISFKGAATDIYSAPAFTWSWGDGSESAGPSPSHAFAAAGSYLVTMRVTDELTGATTPPVTQTIAVAAPVSAQPPAPVVPKVVAPVVPPADSSFSAGASAFSATTGVITFTATVGDPGTFSWLLTFQNGKFGVFAASSRKCKAGQVRLGGKCRPSKVVFAKGSQVVSAPGTVTFKLKPSASGLKALKYALKQKKGLPVTITLTFQSARGGSSVSQTKTMTVKLKKH